MCPYFTSELRKLLTHIVRKHRHDPNFLIHCNFAGCGMSYKNYLSFKKHVSRIHGGLSSINAPNNELHVNDLDLTYENEGNVCDSDDDNAMKSEAAFC